MKRSPMKPRTAPMPRGKPLASTKAQLPRFEPLKPVNKARKAKRKADGLVYGPYHDFVGTLPCLLRTNVIHMCRGTVRGHHIVSVGAGGVDEGNEVPLCDAGHTLSMKSVHALGRESFEAYWKIRLEEEARRVAEAYRTAA